LWSIGEKKFGAEAIAEPQQYKPRKDTMSRVSHINYNGEWIPLSKVEFVNIEEDFSGRDLVTFRKDGKDHQSFVTLRPNPKPRKKNK
jgi:hypothetical protein